MIELNQIYNEDCRETLARMPENFLDCVVTSPPYFGLRDYGVDGQIGLEPTPKQFVDALVEVFAGIHRALKPSGTVWLNLGDSYVANRGNTAEKPGHDNKAVHGTLAVRDWKIPGKPKDLIGIPWRVAFALQDFGYYLRQDIIWSKPNPMPESVKDRCTKSHEYIFLLSKSDRYFFNADAIAERAKYSNIVGMDGSGFKPPQDFNGEHSVCSETLPIRSRVEGVDHGKRNRRSVWNITTKPFSDAHFATFPPELPELCIKAGCPEGGIVYDPFSGAGTTALVAYRCDRNFIGSELNPDYVEMSRKRLHAETRQMKLFGVPMAS